MGYSDSVKLKLARKISALAGTIWRTNELALYEASQEDDTLLGGFEGEIIPPNPIFFRTLSLTAKENDGRLTSMLLDAGENMLAALYSVKHTILVAALVQLGAAETAAAAAAVEPATINPTVDHADPISPSNIDSSPRPNYDSSATTTSDTDISLQDPAPSSSVDSAKSKSTKGKNKESGDSQLRVQRKQVRILNWRAEAMAEALREDLRGFTLPDGAY